MGTQASKTITLCDTQTGYIKTIEVGDDEDSEYYWEEGSGSCDCVRLQILYPDMRNPPCGESRVEIVEDAHGR